MSNEESETSVVDEVIKTTEEVAESIVKKISDNKIYIIIGLVIILGGVMYYFYINNKKQTELTTTTIAPNPVKIMKQVKQKPKAPVIVHPPLSDQESDEAPPKVNNEENNLSEYDLTNSELKQINSQLENIEN